MSCSQNDGRKSVKLLREKTVFLRGSIKSCLSVLQTSQEFAEIILGKFEVFWSPFTEANWDRGDFASNTLGFFWWHKQNPSTIKIKKNI